MHNYLLMFGMWFGLGVLFASASGTVVWGAGWKENLTILALLCILCAVFGPFTAMLLYTAKWANKEDAK